MNGACQCLKRAELQTIEPWVPPAVVDEDTIPTFVQQAIAQVHGSKGDNVTINKKVKVGCHHERSQNKIGRGCGT